ncbi:hypothetical protein FXF51_48150 [Nonomuraea sp. PA05]|uniref:MmyB family transcriptional regulator n=1 Tax=Nonomuraea sp. PA05 TaxID=2604466 RepID=UPI0011DA6508|nr:hypothetical protein [Nonomuraea sp. PA05]TYB54157.1 hypothetical protein FXF51_48150 [Nonomuraea sp. PA05]
MPSASGETRSPPTCVASWAAHPDDKGLADLVEELTSGSEEFARLWAMRDVRVNAQAAGHAAEGPLTLEYEVLDAIARSCAA